MLKNIEIIEKLTLEEKLSLLTDIGALKEKRFPEYGVDCLGCASLAEVNEGMDEVRYPTFENLANTWNPQLIANAVEALSVQAKEKGIALLETPQANVMTTPYSVGLSEDPVLCGTLIGSMTSAVGKSGLKAVVSNPMMSAIDVQYSDLKYNARAVHEYIKQPFKEAFIGSGTAIRVNKKTLGGEYQDVNGTWLEELADKHPLLMDCHSAQEQVALMREEGRFACGEDYYTLLSGVERYETLRQGFEKGNISLSELETACANGSALSPEAIDDAVDKVLTFLGDCQNKKADVRGNLFADKIGLRLAEESIVLLKNDDVLPIKGHRKIAVVGDIEGLCGGANVEKITDYATKLKQKGKLLYTGHAKGYAYGKSRSDKMIPEAVALANKADITLVFIGHSERDWQRTKRNRTTKLPANQLALLEALSNTPTKIIAVVCGNGYPDMGFDKKCKGVLLSPITSSHSAAAIVNVLTGTTSPSGKLAQTCYEDTEEYYRTLRAYKDAKRNKVGTFYGYRHYDISGVKVKYPFGYGLSYTKFSCYSAHVVGGVLTFTIKNVGSREGMEVVQIYIGKDKSSLVRPKKELKTFFKVNLKPGQTQTLSVRLNDLDLSVWDENRKRMVRESGVYEYYICSSVTSVMNKGSFTIGGDVITADQQRYADYLQSFSNIKRGGYYLEEPIPTKKRSGALRKTSWTWFYTMVCLSLVYLYFVYVRWLPSLWFVHLIVLGLTVTPFVMAISATLDYKNKLRKEQEVSMKKKMKKREELNINDLADEIPYELLFAQEFATPALDASEQVVEEKVEEDTEFLRHVPFDKSFTFSVIKEEFTTFAYERGVSLDEESVRTLISAFAASRLIVLQCDDKEKQAQLLAIISEYFGSRACVDTVPENGKADFLYVQTEMGEFGLTNAAKLFTDEAADNDNKLQMVAITDVQSGEVKAMLSQLIRYIDQPYRKAQLFIRKEEDGKEDAYNVPEGTWIILSLAQGQKLLDMPKFVLDLASVVTLKLQSGKKAKTSISLKKKTVKVQEEGETTEEVKEEGIELAETVVEEAKTQVKQLLYSQFDKLVNHACRDYQLDETLWKRVDRLEEYVDGYSAYSIENKQWQRMEKFVSSYLALGGNAENALDNVLAQQLICGCVSTLSESNKKLDEKFSHTLENIFGSGSVMASLKALRDTGKSI